MANYVDKEEFLKAILEYKELCEEAENSGADLPIIPDYIGQCILEISERLATRPNFSGYSFRDEMVSDGLENAIQALGNFDPHKSTNPFGYFTQIIWYAFLRRIEKEKKQLYIRHKVIESSMVQGTLMTKNSGDSGEAAYVNPNTDYMNNFVKDYEAKEEAKVKARAERRKASQEENKV